MTAHEKPTAKAPKAVKLPTAELLRLACIYAEIDREAYLDAITNSNDTETIEETQAFLKQLRAYRKRRWGKTQTDADTEAVTSVPIQDFFKKK